MFLFEPNERKDMLKKEKKDKKERKEKQEEEHEKAMKAMNEKSEESAVLDKHMPPGGSRMPEHPTRASKDRPGGPGSSNFGGHRELQDHHYA